VRQHDDSGEGGWQVSGPHEQWLAKQGRIDTPEQWKRVLAEGRRLERAAIVADLREWCGRFGITVQDRMLLMAAVARYERGEHEEGK
jgi:hypothetical protein